MEILCVYVRKLKEKKSKTSQYFEALSMHFIKQT